MKLNKKQKHQANITLTRCLLSTSLIILTLGQWQSTGKSIGEKLVMPIVEGQLICGQCHSVKSELPQYQKVGGKAFTLHHSSY